MKSTFPAATAELHLLTGTTVIPCFLVSRVFSASLYYARRGHTKKKRKRKKKKRRFFFLAATLDLHPHKNLLFLLEPSREIVMGSEGVFMGLSYRR
jgi:hypothetical protein